MPSLREAGFPDPIHSAAANIGLAPNHNFVFGQARGELFKWVSHDDLYARDLLQRCVDALDEHPQVVLAPFLDGNSR